MRTDQPGAPGGNPLLGAIAILRALRAGEDIDNFMLARSVEAFEAAQAAMEVRAPTAVFVDFQSLLALAYRVSAERLSGAPVPIALAKAREAGRYACRKAAEFEEKATDDLLKAFAFASDETGRACLALAGHTDGEEAIELLGDAAACLRIASSAYRRVGLDKPAQAADLRAFGARTAHALAVEGRDHRAAPLPGMNAGTRHRIVA
jgi:hypothetical protein